MRLWSIHPQYLDSKGLVALWREALLAQHVLEGKTKGYTNHPQLNRFKECKNAKYAINQYLSEVYNEAILRNYNFDKTKIDWSFKPVLIPVTNGQIEYEFKHLINKLKVRDLVKYKAICTQKKIAIFNIFKEKMGAIEPWEII